MKTNQFFYLCMALFMTIAISCKDDDDDDNPVVEASQIKTINIDYDGTAADVEGWEFKYDATTDRVTSIINTYNGSIEDTILYDYSTAGKLIITKGGNPTTYELNSDGRVSKELWVADGSEYEGYTYNADGILTKIIEHYGGADHLKYDLTVASKNVTNRIRYEDDLTVREDREFTYTTGDNASNIQQIYAVDSEWKPVGGLFGEASAKLASGFVRHITADPLSTYGVTFTYTFDAKNRPATITKNGTSSSGPYTEILTYTYYE
jgi:hypothetical protein